MKKAIVLSFVFLFVFVNVASAEIVISPAFTKTLKYGIKSDPQVLLLQRVLIKKGFLASNAIPQGNYTTRTRSAVKEFQRQNFIVPDGIVGLRTRNVLNKIFFDNPRFLDSAVATNSIGSSGFQNQTQTGVDSPWVHFTPITSPSYNPNNYSYNYYTPGYSRPYVTVSNPSVGSNFNTGDTMNISWSTGNFVNPVTIKLSLVTPNGWSNALQTVYAISSGTVNDYSESWLIPNSIVTGNNYYILIEASDGVNSAASISSGAFSINSVNTNNTINYPPAVTAYQISNTNLTPTTATIEGTIDSKNLNTDTWLEYGKTQSLGNVTTVQKNVNGAVSFNLSSLDSNQKYYYQIGAKNSAGTTYSSPMLSFTTPIKATNPQAPFSDLTISDLSFTPTTLTQTFSLKTLSYSFTIKNTGPISLFIPANTEFVLYKNATKVGSYVFSKITLINAGDTKTITDKTFSSVNIASNAGTFNMTLKADVNGLVSELDKTNNSITKSFVVALFTAGTGGASNATGTTNTGNNGPM